MIAVGWSKLIVLSERGEVVRHDFINLILEV